MRAIIIVSVGLESGGPGQQHEALPEFASQQDLITSSQIVKNNADSNEILSCQHFVQKHWTPMQHNKADLPKADKQIGCLHFILRRLAVI